MAELNYEEIIALSENPTVTSDEVRGQPPSPESLKRVADLADELFYQCPFEEKVEDIPNFPVEISARRLARMTDSERTELFSHLPDRLVESIVALLPINAY